MKTSKLQEEVHKVLLGNPRIDAFMAAERAYDALAAEKQDVVNSLAKCHEMAGCNLDGDMCTGGGK